MQMDIKQKTLLALTVAAFGYLGYQVYGLMKNDTSNPPAVVQSPMVHNSHGPVATANAAEPQHVLRVMQQAPIPTTTHPVPLVTGQKAYLHMVNQYELAKMRRRLLEEKAAIAAAKHRIATLDKQTHDINASLAGAQEPYDDTISATPKRVVFRLSYVDHQNGEWSATLNKNGRYYQVHPGSTLADGSAVVSIDRSGVMLKKGKNKERIMFDGVVQAPETKAPPAPKTPTISKSSTVSTTPKTPTETKIEKTPKAVSVKKVSAVAVTTSPVQVLQAQARRALVTADQLSKTVGGKERDHAHYTKDERRLLAMSRHAYTIQLIGSYHRDVVENFAIANDLGNRAMQFYVINRGKRWYVLLYDHYPTRRAAEKALKHLPSNLTPETPWVRSIAVVQHDIRVRHHRRERRRSRLRHSAAF